MRKISLLLFILLVSLQNHVLAQKYKSRAYDQAYSQIKSKKTIVIAISDHYPPLHFNGKGVQIEMANSLANFLEVKLKVAPYQSGKTIQAVENAEVDISIAGIFRSLPRAKRVWFSRPYLWAHATALVDRRLVPQKKFGDFFEETPIQSLSELKKLSGISAVVVSGSVYEDDFADITKKKSVLSCPCDRLSSKRRCEYIYL